MEFERKAGPETALPSFPFMQSGLFLLGRLRPGIPMVLKDEVEYNRCGVVSPDVLLIESHTAGLSRRGFRSGRKPLPYRP